MIISDKHKYIFVGLPFRASTAISKELVDHYNGKLIHQKHTLTKEVKPTLNINDYHVFIVKRDPFDIVHTYYTKLKNNDKGKFTDPNSFLINGGYLTEKARRAYQFVSKNKSFYQYILRYRWLPYDDFLSLEYKNAQSILNFETLKEDFKSFLSNLEITPVRDLPVINKTANKEVVNFFKNNTLFQKILLSYVFYPYLNQYDIRNVFVEKNIGYYIGNCIYFLIKPFRKFYWFITIKKRSKNNLTTFE